jgi:hypothetical protein
VVEHDVWHDVVDGALNCMAEHATLCADVICFLGARHLLLPPRLFPR